MKKFLLIIPFLFAKAPGNLSYELKLPSAPSKIVSVQVPMNPTISYLFPFLEQAGIPTKNSKEKDILSHFSIKNVCTKEELNRLVKFMVAGLNINCLEPKTIRWLANPKYKIPAFLVPNVNDLWTCFSSIKQIVANYRQSDPMSCNFPAAQSQAIQVIIDDYIQKTYDKLDVVAARIEQLQSTDKNFSEQMWGNFDFILLAESDFEQRTKQIPNSEAKVKQLLRADVEKYVENFCTPQAFVALTLSYALR